MLFRSVRSILDGHIVLSRELAARNHYPCIDILHSASRVMRDIISPEHQRSSAKIREILATHKQAEDLINIGAYASGSNPRIDYAISRIDAVNSFLCQGMDERDTLEGSITAMNGLVLDRRSKDRDTP